MEQVLTGLMLPGAQRFMDKNINPTWKVHVKTNESTIGAYVKKIPYREIYVECVCAILGRCLELPIPRPILVKITHEALPDIVPENQFSLAFGSEDADYPSFRRFAVGQEAFMKLMNFAKTVDVGVFDEWIGNFDRNWGNILFDGGEEFVFIDHGNAIQSSLSIEQPERSNEIIDKLFSMQSEFERFKLNKEVNAKIIPQYPNLPYPLIAEKTSATSYLPEQDILNIINFLQQRTNYLSLLFESRLGLGLNQYRLHYE